MPGSKSKKKKKSPSCSKDKDKTQSKLEDFLTTPNANTFKSDIKKQTPPSLTEVTPKRLNMSVNEDKNETMEVEESCSSSEDTASEHSDTEKKFSEGETEPVQNESFKYKLDARLCRMEQRITKAVTIAVTNSIEKLIETALHPLKEDIRKLGVSSEKQETKMSELTNIQRENTELKKIVEDIKSENLELKTRLNKIENKLLENNFIILGVPENSWETDGELRATVFNLISYTVDALDPQIQLQMAKKAKLTKVQRIGNYSRRRGRLISIQFADKDAAEYFWENKGYLPESLYVKREYTDETEQN